MPLDETLKKKLIETGQQNKLVELENAYKKGGFLSTIKEATKQFFVPGSEAQKKVIVPVAKFIAPVGESVGSAIALGKIGKFQTQSSKDFKKAQEETLKNEVNLQNQFLKAMRDTSISDVDKFRILSKNIQNNPNLLEQIPEANKTAKQIFGEGAVTALNSVAGISAAGKLVSKGVISKALININQTINKLGKGKQSVTTLGGSIEGIKDAPVLSKMAGSFLRVARTALGGASFGAATALEKDTDIKNEAGIYAGISVFAPPIIGKAIKSSTGLIGNIAKTVNKGAEKLIPKLEKIASKRINPTGNFLIDTANSQKTPIKNSLAEIAKRSLETGIKPLEPALVDRLYNIKKFDEFAEVITGNRISNTPNSSYIKARNFAGIEGKYTIAANDFKNIIDKDYKEIKDELLGYVKGLDLLNRVSRGQSIETGLSAKQIQRELLDIENRVTEKGLTIDNLQKGVKAYNDFTRKNILDEFTNSGLISKADADNIIKENPNWVPHDVLDFYENKASDAFLKGGSFNVSDNAIKAAKGSERELATIDIATLHRVQQAKVLAERNKVMRSIFEKVEKDVESFGFLPMRTANSVKAKILIYENLSDLFSSIKNIKKDIKVVNKQGKKIAQKINIKDIEMEQLVDEARVMASEIDTKTNINKVLDKAFSREKRIFQLSGQAELKLVEANELNKLLEDRKEFVNVLKNELKDVRDLKFKEADIQKAGFEKVSYYNDGIREDWLVPTDLGIALKNLNAPQAGLIAKWLKIPADILRAGATRLNIGFSISNFPRDLQTAAGISKEGFSKRQLIEALNDVTNFNNPETRAFYEGGGAFGGMISSEKPSRDILAASKRAPILNAGTNLAKTIETIGERVENATRFAVYKGAINSGMSHELAIFEARNATVDFSKQGNVVGVLNQVIPFLNARVQGMVNTASSINSDPTKFVRRQLFQSVYPALYLYSHDNQYESFKNIPQYERDQNWIIMYGESDGFDNNGAPIKIPEYIKIRKSEVQIPFANAVEQYLDISNKENPREVGKFLQDTLLGTSPISISSFGPLSTPIELTANYDLFTKAEIEPEFQEVVEGGKKFPRDEVPVELRANRWTGETARKLSNSGLSSMGISPARVEFIVGKIFGTTGKDLLRLVDMTQTGLDQTGIPDGEATTEQKLARMPVFRTFIGSNAAGEKIMLYEIVKKASQEQFDRIEMPRELEAMSILEQAVLINQKQGREEANKYIMSLDLNKDMKTRIKRIKENTEKGQTNQKQIYDKIVGNSVKLRYLIENLNMIDTKEQKNNFILDMDISKDLMNKLRQAKKEGLIKKPIDTQNSNQIQ